MIYAGNNTVQMRIKLQSGNDWRLTQRVGENQQRNNVKRNTVKR